MIRDDDKPETEEHNDYIDAGIIHTVPVHPFIMGLTERRVRLLHLFVNSYVLQ